MPQTAASLEDPSVVRESVAGLSATRPYDLGRHTHSALMLAADMTLQRLARIQGHSIRVLDETYSEQLAEYEDRSDPIEPVAEIQPPDVSSGVARSQHRRSPLATSGAAARPSKIAP